MLLFIIFACGVCGYCLWYFKGENKLNRRIARRIQDAERRQILEKAECILDMYSGFLSTEYADAVLIITRSEKVERTKNNWVESGETERTTKDVGIRMADNKQLVYAWNERTDNRDGSFSRGVNCYVPGEWERHFEALHEKAGQKKGAWLKEQDMSRTQRIKQNFGL